MPNYCFVNCSLHNVVTGTMKLSVFPTLTSHDLERSVEVTKTVRICYEGDDDDDDVQ